MRAIAVTLGVCVVLTAQQMSPLVGEVVDEHGAPVTDAVVIVWRGEGRGLDCPLDTDHSHSWREVARTPVDRTGHFGMQLPIGLMLRVEVEHDGHARWRRDDLTPSERLRVELERPRTFRGRLLRKSTGNGTPGFLRGWAEDRTELFRGRTDAAGNFEFARLPARAFTCEVVSDEVASVLFEGRWDDDVLERNFVLDDGAVLSGVVFDSATGKPIAGARVGHSWTMDTSVTTGADGRYVLRGHGDKWRAFVHVCAAGYVARAVRESTESGEVTVDLALLRGAGVAGVVVDLAGKPLRDVYLVLVAGRKTYEILYARTDARGAFAIDELPTDVPGALLLRRDGSATAVYELPPRGAGTRMDLGTLRLLAPKCVRGVLVDSDGKPVVGAAVRLSGTNDDREQFAHDHATWQYLSQYLGQRTMRTDSNGAFGFGDMTPGKYEITLDVAEESTLARIEVDAKDDPEPLRLVSR